jgi:hypothetical protein
MTIKQFLMLEENKKAYWTALNWFMSFVVAYTTYQVSENVAWAVTVLPIAKILSEMLTRYLNDKSFKAYK